MQTVELILIALMAITLCVLCWTVIGALGKIGGLTAQIEQFLGATQKELTAALEETRGTLDRAERLLESTEAVVRGEVGPTLQVTRATLANVEKTTRTVSSALEGVGKVAGIVNAVASPDGLIATARNTLKTPAGRYGLLALGVKMGMEAFMKRPSAHTQPVVRRDSNGKPG